MIGYIQGTIIHVGGSHMIVDTKGVGYEIAVPLPFSLSKKMGQDVKMWVRLIARETVLDLYGFETREEREFFDMLISISGIGPKSALDILSLENPAGLKRAIRSGDIGYLTKISGIGKKSAEKIVLELRDKVGSTDEESGVLLHDTDVLEALTALGYRTKDARNVIRELPTTLSDTNERIREALKKLGS